MNAIIDGWKCWASHSFSLSQLPHLQNRMVLLPLLISQSCSKIQRKHAEENPLQGHDYCHNPGLDDSPVEESQTPEVQGPDRLSNSGK